MPEREVRRGAVDGGRGPQFKLPSTRIPEPVIPGVRGWTTGEGWLVLRLHYTADPERASDEWIKDQLKGYRGGMEGRDWRREMEIDFSAYAGDPVYPAFDATDAVKVTNYNPHLPLWRGWDFGYRHPAVVWVQLWPDNTLAFLHELYPTLDKEALPGIKTSDLVQLALTETERLFPGANNRTKTAGVWDFCDPAGTQHKDTSDFSNIEIMQQAGIDAEWSVVGRKNRVNYLRRYVEEPGAFRINPHCTLGIKALGGAYRYPEERGGGADREMPDVGKVVQEQPYIHIMDALEYVAACNLHIEWAVRDTEEQSSQRNIGELAEMYLGISQEDPGQPVDSYLESFLSDFVGDEGDFSDAFSVT